MKMIKADWPAPTNVKAFTTTKLGWQTEQATPSSQRMRDEFEQHFATPTTPIWLKQTHGVTAVEAIPENLNKEADASFAQHKKAVCLVFTADCLPILLCNKDASVVAAIHAGWRGLANGVIESTVAALPANDRLMAWLGPAIGPEKFEVGADVYTAFTELDKNTATAFKPYREGKWLADLYQLARMKLQKLNITDIYGGEYCTHTQSDLFYSYRRDHGNSGRMASAIWVE